MKKINFIIALFLSFFLLSCAIYAQEATPAKEPAKQRFDIGAGYWYTNATTDYFAYASETDLFGGLFYMKGDKISELNNDLDAGLFIVDMDAWLWWRFYADGSIGWGEFEGEHTDSDWLPRFDSSLMQFSESDADGDVVTWNVNGRLRLIEEPEDKGYLDASLGYFYYRDDIEHLRNSTITTYFWESVNAPIAGHDSSDKYTYDGIRLGLKGKIRLHDRVAIKAGGGLCPWLNVKDEKFWNLRADFGPPAGMEATIEADGTAFDLTAGLEFKITKNLFVEAGYKYINLDSDIGDDDRHWLSGVDTTFDDAGEVEAERGGFYAMGRLKI